MIQVEFPWKSGLETFKRDLFWFLQSLDEPGIGGGREVLIIAGLDLKPLIAVMLGLYGESCYDPVRETLCGHRVQFECSGNFRRRVSAFVLCQEDLGRLDSSPEVDAFLVRG